MEIEHASLRKGDLDELLKRLRAARGRILASRSTAEIIALIDRTAAAWRDPTSSWHRQALAALPAVTGLSRAMIARVLPDVFSAYTEDNLTSFVRNELGDALALDGFVHGPFGERRLVGPDILAHITAGNVPGLALPALVVGLLARAAVVIKPAAGEPILAALIAESLARVDPDIGRCIAVAYWPGGSHELESVLLAEADVLTVEGSDEAVRALRDRAKGRVLGFPHRTSLAVVLREETAKLRDIAAELARDVSLYDQLGCLSPQTVYVETGGAAGPQEVARALATALRELERTLRPGRRSDAEHAAIRDFRATAEWRSLSGEDVQVYGDPSSSGATVVHDGDPRFEPTCGHRTVRVKPLARLDALPELLGPFRSVIEAVGVAGSEARVRELTATLAGRTSVSRVCPIGSMQTPSITWPRGGFPRLASLLRCIDIERAAAPSPEERVGRERPDQADLLRTTFSRHVCQTSPNPLSLIVDRAEGSWIYESGGRRYLDLLSGIGVVAIGHRHPEVVRAVHAQADAYLHTMVYGEHVQRPQVRLAARLAELLPHPLSVTYFTNSGTEAVEGALKTARKATGRQRFVAFEGSFHGDTFGSASVGGNPLYTKPFEPLLPGVSLLPFDDPPSLERIDERVAAVIVEPVQAEAGVRLPSEGFLGALRDRTRQVGALLIFDEVITGLGRCGHLWALERWGVVPDLLVLAKALGGGLPLGAFVGAPHVMETLSKDPPLAHVTTFGGHPLSCAAGLAGLEVIVRERLWERANVRGTELEAALTPFVGRGIVAAVRRLGLLVGIEFDRSERARAFVDDCLARGLLVGWTLHDDRVVRLAPPLTLTDEESALARREMSAAIQALA